VAVPLLPGSGRKVEVAENKTLNPFYPGPQPHTTIPKFRAFSSRPSVLPSRSKVQPLPTSTHRTPSGIMPRTCLQAPKEPSAPA
jgi:hypothetical protein